MSISKLSRSYLVLLACAFVLASCAGATQQEVEDEKNPLTHGNVQLNLKVGVTTQTQILEAFGAPNITSIDGEGKEVWTYRRAASVSKSKEKGGGFFLLFGGYGASSSGFSSTQRTITLIIKFSEQKIVSDFKSRSSAF